MVFVPQFTTAALAVKVAPTEKTAELTTPVELATNTPAVLTTTLARPTETDTLDYDRVASGVRSYEIIVEFIRRLSLFRLSSSEG